MREPDQFDRERERTQYQGRRMPISSEHRGMSLWSTVLLGLLLVLVVLLVANSWRGTPTVAPLKLSLYSTNQSTRLVASNPVSPL
jgi:hypothetical protein